MALELGFPLPPASRGAIAVSTFTGVNSSTSVCAIFSIYTVFNVNAIFSVGVTSGSCRASSGVPVHDATR
jgi:hypothetical protein